MKNRRANRFMRITAGMLASVLVITEFWNIPATYVNGADVTLQAEVWGCDATFKVLQNVDNYESVKKEAKVALNVAKGEYEAQQIIISAKKDLTYDMTVSDLTSAEGTLLSVEHIDVFHEKYIEISTNYNNGVTGMYPDAIVPLENIKNCGENTVQAGENQGIYIRFHIPQNQPAGLYTGNFQLKIGNETMQIPVSLNVLDIEIPEENHVKSIYLVRYGNWLGEQNGSQDMVNKYTEMLYDYRLCSADLMPENYHTEEDVAYYTELAYKYMQNPKCSLVTIPYLWKDTTIDKEISKKYLRAFAEKSFATGYNMLEKSGAYIVQIDEPYSRSRDEDSVVEQTSRDWTALCNEVADELANNADITSSIKEEVIQSVRQCYNVVTTGDVEHYSPLGVTTFCANFIDYDTEAKRDMYHQEERWWYGGIYPRDPYPCYQIDIQSLIGPRVMGWMQADYDVTGNLLWSTDLYVTDVDGTVLPIEDYYDTAERFANANGDGFLLYPGAAYGIDGPVATLRLEAIRDGFEEYELLQDLKKRYEEKNGTLGETCSINSEAFMKMFAKLLYNGAKVMADDMMYAQARNVLLNLCAWNQSEAEVCLADYVENADGTKALSFYVKEGATLLINGNEIADKKNVSDGVLYSVSRITGNEQKVWSFTVKCKDKNYTCEMPLGVQKVVKEPCTITAQDVSSESGVIYSYVTGVPYNLDDRSFAKLYLSQTETDEKQTVRIAGDYVSALNSKADKAFLTLYCTNVIWENGIMLDPGAGVDGCKQVDVLVSAKLKNRDSLIALTSDAKMGYSMNVIALSLSDINWAVDGEIEYLQLQFGDTKVSDRTVYLSELLVYGNLSGYVEKSKVQGIVKPEQSMGEVSKTPISGTQVLLDFEEYATDFQLFRVNRTAGRISQSTERVKSGKYAAKIQPLGGYSSGTRPAFYYPLYSKTAGFNYKDIRDWQKVTMWVYNDQNHVETLRVGLVTQINDFNSYATAWEQLYELQPNAWNQVEYVLDMEAVGITCDVENIQGICFSFENQNARTLKDAPVFYMDDVTCHVSEESQDIPKLESDKDELNGRYEIIGFDNPLHEKSFYLEATKLSAIPEAEIVYAADEGITATEGSKVLKVTIHGDEFGETWNQLVIPEKIVRESGFMDIPEEERSQYRFCFDVYRTHQNVGIVWEFYVKGNTYQYKPTSGLGNTINQWQSIAFDFDSFTGSHLGNPGDIKLSLREIPDAWGTNVLYLDNFRYEKIEGYNESITAAGSESAVKIIRDISQITIVDETISEELKNQKAITEITTTSVDTMTKSAFSIPILGQETFWNSLKSKYEKNGTGRFLKVRMYMPKGMKWEGSLCFGDVSVGTCVYSDTEIKSGQWVDYIFDLKILLEKDVVPSPVFTATKGANVSNGNSIIYVSDIEFLRGCEDAFPTEKLFIAQGSTKELGIGMINGWNVEYTSSNEAVATVDANGRVTGVGRGEAVITVTLRMGNTTDTRTYRVEVAKVSTIDSGTNKLDTTKENAYSDQNIWFAPRGEFDQNIINWITLDNNEAYVEYLIDVKTAGVYELVANISNNEEEGGAFDVYADNVKIASYQFDKTGAYDFFRTCTQEVSLQAGIQTLKIVFTKQANMSWLTFQCKMPAAAIIGNVVGEKTILYTNEGNKIASQNVGFGSRPDSEFASSNIINWTTPEQGEAYVEYLIDVKESGYYELVANVSTNEANGSSFDVYAKDKKIASFEFATTWGWNLFREEKNNLYLESGVQVLKIVFKKNANMSWLKFTKLSSSVVVQGVSLTLDGKIGVNFYLNPMAHLVDSGAKVQFSFNGKQVVQEITSEDYVASKGVYRFTYYVAASQMADEVQIQVLNADGVLVQLLNSTGNVLDDKTYRASVKEYAEFMIANPGNAEWASCVELLKAMLNYGKCSQRYFNYKAENLILDYNMSGVTKDILASYAFKTEGTIDGMACKGMSLLLDSETSIHVFFALEGENQIEDYIFTYKGESLKPMKRGNLYYVKIANIAAPELGDTQTLTIHKNGSDSVCTVGCSAYSYGYSVLKSSNNVKLRNVAKALYCYGKLAKEYFTN